MNCGKCVHRVKTEGNGDCDHPIGLTGPDGDECPLEFNPVMLKWLEQENVFKVEVSEDKKALKIIEMADEYYSKNLLRHQVMTLALELLEISKHMDNAD